MMDAIHGSSAEINNLVLSVTVDLDGQLKTIRGRDAWALAELISAGNRGITPIERPAPRWSHYTFKLRRASIAIETIDEPHGGAYAGTHARYVLRSSLRVVEITRQSDARAGRKDGARGFAPLPALEGAWR
jgi:hypothetical protein